MALLAALLLARRRPVTLGALGVAAVLLAFAFARAPSFLTFPPEESGQLNVVLRQVERLQAEHGEQRVRATRLFSRWDRTARIDVYGLETTIPELKGRPVESYFLVQDSCAGSILLGVGEDLGSARLFRGAHHLRCGVCASGAARAGAGNRARRWARRPLRPLPRREADRGRRDQRDHHRRGAKRIRRIPRAALRTARRRDPPHRRAHVPAFLFRSLRSDPDERRRHEVGARRRLSLRQRELPLHPRGDGGDSPSATRRRSARAEPLRKHRRSPPGYGGRGGSSRPRRR